MSQRFQLVVDGKPISRNRVHHLRFVSVDGLEHWTAIFSCTIKERAEGERELWVYGKDKEPIYKAPLKQSPCGGATLSARLARRTRSRSRPRVWETRSSSWTSRFWEICRGARALVRRVDFTWGLPCDNRGGIGLCSFVIAQITGCRSRLQNDRLRCNSVRQRTDWLSGGRKQIAEESPNPVDVSSRAQWIPPSASEIRSSIKA